MAAINRYQGELYYEDSSKVIIPVFIVRQDEIAFAFSNESTEYGRWDAASGVPARLQPNGDYVAENVQASQRGVPAALPWKITFRLGEEVPGEFIEVSGSLSEGSSTWEFEGALEAIVS